MKVRERSQANDIVIPLSRGESPGFALWGERSVASVDVSRNLQLLDIIIKLRSFKAEAWGPSTKVHMLLFQIYAMQQGGREDRTVAVLHEKLRDSNGRSESTIARYLDDLAKRGCVVETPGQLAPAGGGNYASIWSTTEQFEDNLDTLHELFLSLTKTHLGGPSS